jgi:hypothetical protein
MQDNKPSIFLFIFLAAVILGLLHIIGGFDDAAVRDLNNQHLLQPIKFLNK